MSTLILTVLDCLVFLIVGVTVLAAITVMCGVISYIISYSRVRGELEAVVDFETRAMNSRAQCNG